MIALPPGSSVSYNIRIIVQQIPDSMIEWWCMVGGSYEEVAVGWSRKGTTLKEKVLSFNGAKPSYVLKDGTNHVILTFFGKDATTASMFIIKFAEYIITHNMKEYETYAY